MAAASSFEGAIPILRIFDEAKAREFYCDFLGIGTTPRPGVIDDAIGGCWLQLPHMQVHVIDAQDDGSSGNPVGPHLSFYVDDIDGAIREVEERGLEKRVIPMGELGKVVWFTDPAGNTVELQQDPEVRG